ncbi:MAG: hypothetical protein ACRD0U_17195 [Acidimicrobiales bacterium]
MCLLEVLRGQGVLGAEQPRAVSPEEVLLGSFEAYLLVERGMAVGTVHGYVGHARRFLGCSSSTRVRVADSAMNRTSTSLALSRWSRSASTG